MRASHQQKDVEVQQIRESFSRSTAVVFLDFRGTDVPTVTELRSRFRAAGIDYKVVKNNLVRRALVGTPFEGNSSLDAFLKGPTGVAWSYEDPSAAAKIIKAFRKEGDAHEKVQVKCGLLDGQVLDAKRVEAELANLPGKDELRAMLLATMLAPAQQLVRQLGAAGQSLAFVLDARKRQLEEG